MPLSNYDIKNRPCLNSSDCPEGSRCGGCDDYKPDYSYGMDDKEDDFNESDIVGNCVRGI